MRVSRIYILMLAMIIEQFSLGGTAVPGIMVLSNSSPEQDNSELDRIVILNETGSLDQEFMLDSLGQNWGEQTLLNREKMSSIAYFVSRNFKKMGSSIDEIGFDGNPGKNLGDLIKNYALNKTKGFLEKLLNLDFDSENLLIKNALEKRFGNSNSGVVENSSPLERYYVLPDGLYWELVRQITPNQVYSTLKNPDSEYRNKLLLDVKDLLSGQINDSDGLKTQNIVSQNLEILGMQEEIPLLSFERSILASWKKSVSKFVEEIKMIVDVKINSENFDKVFDQLEYYSQLAPGVLDSESQEILKAAFLKLDIEATKIADQKEQYLQYKTNPASRKKLSINDLSPQ